MPNIVFFNKITYIFVILYFSLKENSGSELFIDNTNLWLNVNGGQLQNSNTSDLVFQKQVSYISRFMTLPPVDVISARTLFLALVWVSIRQST